MQCQWDFLPWVQAALVEHVGLAVGGALGLVMKVVVGFGVFEM